MQELGIYLFEAIIYLSIYLEEQKNFMSDVAS